MVIFYLEIQTILIEDAKSFNHGFSSVKSKGKWGIMNSKGEWLVQPTYDAVNVL